MFICMQEIQFIPPFFLETLQYCKLAILSTLGMPGYGHQEGWHQLVEKCDGYLHATNEIYHSPLCRNMATIFQIYFGYFRLAWPRPPKSMTLTSRKLWCAKIDMQNSTWSLFSFLGHYTLKNPVIWLAESILAQTWEQEIC